LAALVFATAGWTWHEKGVPQASSVHECFERLLTAVVEGGGWSKGTGRLVVEKDELHGYSLLMRLGDISIDEESGE
jgi:hypothetical protein